MSERNGDRARFQKDRKRKLRHRQRIQALAAALRNRREAVGAADRRAAAGVAEVTHSAQLPDSST
jgi:uncharacterized membrane protein